MSTSVVPERVSSGSHPQQSFEAEIATLIVDVLRLEIEAAAIEPDEALFSDGLGLDSIDALELALAISQRYGVNLRSDDENNAAIFASLRSLSRFIAASRAR